MNPRVTKPVGHIALAFSREDEHRLTDRTMAGIALEYLERMGIKDTQALVVRHFDKERIRDYNRITIGTREQMDILLEKLREFL